MAAPGILATIGNTPLVRLRRCAPEDGAEIWVKLEWIRRSPLGFASHDDFAGIAVSRHAVAADAGKAGIGGGPSW